MRDENGQVILLCQKCKVVRPFFCVDKDKKSYMCSFCLDVVNGISEKDIDEDDSLYDEKDF